MKRLLRTCSAIRPLPQLALALSLWLGAAGQAWAVGVRVTKPIIEHTLAPGEAVQDSIELINQDEQPVFLDVYLEDWRYILPGDGDKEFAPPQTLPRSCAEWVRFFPTRVEVPAHGRAVVDYTIRVPQDEPLDGGYYAVLFFEATIGEVPAAAAAKEEAEPGATVRFAARLGSLMLIDVKGTVRREGRLGPVSVTAPGAARALTIKTTLANEGNVYLKCQPSFHLMTPGSLVVGRGEFPLRYLWPGMRVPLTAEWTGSLQSGDYLAVVTAECGEDLVIVEEAAVALP